MAKNPLNIVSGGPDRTAPPPRRRSEPSRNERTEEIRARFERLWLVSPERFNPERCSLERERVKRTWELIQSLPLGPETHAVDLGFGWGVLTKLLHQAGTVTEGVDIAANAIKRFQEANGDGVRTLREYVPHTSLPDGKYDLVLCTELVADLPVQDQRLLVSELYRLIKSEGHVVFSTTLDIDSDGALERLTTLLETELAIDRCRLSHHAYYLRLLRTLRRPAHYVKAWKDEGYREHQLQKASAIGRTWFKLQCHLPLVAFWWCVEKITTPLANRLEQSDSMLQLLEKICGTISPDQGVSHATLIAKRKPLKASADIAESTMNRANQRLRERVWE